jgi:hypothetical protein
MMLLQTEQQSLVKPFRALKEYDLNCENLLKNKGLNAQGVYLLK